MSLVKTGKLNFRDLVTSLIADLAKLAARRFILGPIANALSGALGGAGGDLRQYLARGRHGRLVRTLAHGPGHDLSPPRPGCISGGAVGLRHDEVPAIPPPTSAGERVLSRREAQSYGAGGGVNVTIMARDAEKLPAVAHGRSRPDIARAVSLGRRGM